MWTGRQAKIHGLVDELGGIGRAVALAKDQVGLDPDEDVELVVFPRPQSLFELLNNGFSVSGALARLGWLPPSAEMLAVAATQPLHMFRPGEPLAILPGALVPGQ